MRSWILKLLRIEVNCSVCFIYRDTCQGCLALIRGPHHVLSVWANSVGRDEWSLLPVQRADVSRIIQRLVLADNGRVWVWVQQLWKTGPRLLSLLRCIATVHAVPTWATLGGRLGNNELHTSSLNSEWPSSLPLCKNLGPSVHPYPWNCGRTAASFRVGQNFRVFSF